MANDASDELLGNIIFREISKNFEISRKVFLDFNDFLCRNEIAIFQMRGALKGLNKNYHLARYLRSYVTPFQGS